jgi:iron complex outermembrane receptor protein
MKIHRYSLLAAAVGAALLTPRGWAADAESAPAATAPAEALEELIVTGTRQSGIKASDSPAPIQIISADEIQKSASSPDLIQTLAKLVPSLFASTFGGDLANLTLQAKLRGLSPNDTLILVNGKRRHTTGNLTVSTGAFQGGAGTDLNFIPVSSIDHIEVLTDGAAAQYGSDAIAGVINIILKKGTEGGNVRASYGGYEDGGGATPDFSTNAGFQPYDGAYLNLTAEVRHHAFSFRGAEDGRLVNPTGINANEFAAPGYPFLNRIAGDAQSDLKIASYNSGFDLGGNAQFYSFGSFGKKQARAYENYRTPSQVAYTDPATKAVSYQFPYGFSPLESIDETDYQVTGGFKGTMAGWNWDVSSGYGRDFIDVYTIHTTNLSIYGNSPNYPPYYPAGTTFRGGVASGAPDVALPIAPPDNYYDGSFKATQWASTVDINRDFDAGLAGPLNVAFGAEYRRETYSILQGTPASYFGAGAASFPGYATGANASRKNYSGYIDLAGKVISDLRVDLAGRYEHYSDFGSKAVGRLTARYDFTPGVALRGTASTGFRAPTIAEEYYTTVQVSPTSAFVQLAPNSSATRDLGYGGLQPESSTNYSLGLVLRPAERFTASLDGYYIIIKNRIVSSGQLNETLNGQIVAPQIAQAILDSGAALDPTVVASGQTGVEFFTNGLNTRTYGAELVADYLSYLGSLGSLDWSLGANYNKTTAYDIQSGTPELAGLPLFDRAAISNLTTAAPLYSINLGARWTLDRLTIDVRELVYGQSIYYTGDAGFYNRSIHAPAGVTFFQQDSGVIQTTNIDISYKVLKDLTLSLGAANVLNRYPDKVNSQLLALQYKYGSNATVGQYTTSPIGFDGGYYFLQAVYSF